MFIILIAFIIVVTGFIGVIAKHAIKFTIDSRSGMRQIGNVEGAVVAFHAALNAIEFLAANKNVDLTLRHARSPPEKIVQKVGISHNAAVFNVARSKIINRNKNIVRIETEFFPFLLNDFLCREVSSAVFGILVEFVGVVIFCLNGKPSIKQVVNVVFAPNALNKVSLSSLFDNPRKFVVKQFQFDSVLNIHGHDNVKPKIIRKSFLGERDINRGHAVLFESIYKRVGIVRA